MNYDELNGQLLNARFELIEDGDPIIYERWDGNVEVIVIDGKVHSIDASVRDFSEFIMPAFEKELANKFVEFLKNPANRSDTHLIE